MPLRPFDHPADPNRKPFRRLVMILWAVALTAVCVRASVQRRNTQIPAAAGHRAATSRSGELGAAQPPSLDPEDREGIWPKNSVYRTYYLAGMRWRGGRSLYRSLNDLPPEVRKARLARQKELQKSGAEDLGRNSGAWGGFRYSPTAALMFVPLTWINPALGEVLWRVFLACLALGGLYWCCRVCLPRPLARRDWATFFLLVLPSVTGCLNNGQSSCLVIGCLLGAVAAVTVERWALAAVLVVVPTLLKLYPVSLGLLLSVTYPRRFSWRFVLLLAAGLALPLLIRPATMPRE